MGNAEERALEGIHPRNVEQELSRITGQPRMLAHGLQVQKETALTRAPRQHAASPVILEQYCQEPYPYLQTLSIGIRQVDTP